MLINTALLQKYLGRPCTTDELLDALMRAGIEVEEEHRLGEALSAVRLGMLEAVEPIAGTEGLRACRLGMGDGGSVDVVVGPGHELEVGWVVPVVLAGTTLPSGKHVDAKPVAGRPSAGMVGLDGEMGLLARGSGLQHWDDASLAGKRFVDIAEVGDEALLDVSILPNRSDCLGLIGIARECAAILGCALVWPEAKGFARSAEDQTTLSVSIAEPARCTRYIGGVIEGVTVGEAGLAGSPAWLSSALMTLGGRPINAVVDVTNFVMFEFGQPLHAFDLGQIEGDAIHVRLLGEGESLTLLGDEELKMPKDVPALVIADTRKPVALAGIKGGAGTGVGTGSTRLLLEAAHFERTGVRKAARAANLSTDSSYRYERGTDPNGMLEKAFERAASLIVALTGGTAVEPAVDRHPTQTERRVFDLGVAKTASYLGTDVSAEEIAGHLSKLGMDCEIGDERLRVSVPTWRVDADDAVVLIEDVARLRGYDAISMDAVSGTPTPGRRSGLDALRARLADLLVGEGFLECRSLPLTDGTAEPMVAAGVEPVRLSNALNADLSAVRRGLVGSLLKAADRSARRGSDRFRYFEIDRAFLAAASVDAAEGEVSAADAGLTHVWKLGGLLTGGLRDVEWGKSPALDFYVVKGLVENLLEGVGLSSAGLDFEPVALPGLASGRAASVSLGDGGRALGVLGELDKGVLKGTQVAGPAFGFELDLEALHGAVSGLAVPTYEALPRFPASVRDLALVVDDGVSFGALTLTIRGAVAGLGDGEVELTSVDCFDRYAGKGVKDGAASLGLRLTFRAEGRTLTSEEVAERVDAAVAALGEKHGVALRG